MSFPFGAHIPFVTLLGFTLETFADGHSEIHKWRDSRTVRGVSYGKVQRVQMGTFNPDLAYLAARTPRAR